MRLVPRSVPLSLALLSALVTASGCPAQRVCVDCDYRVVTVAPIPGGQIERAEMTAQVTHQGECPQAGGPSNCTEQLRYNVKCTIKNGKIVAPMMLDGASTSQRKAWVRITQPNQVAHDVPGTISATGTKAKPQTPCAPPELTGNPKLIVSPQ